MFRSMMIMFALGCFAVGCVADATTEDQAGSVSQATGNFSCENKLSIQVVSCVGSIAVLPISVDIKDVRALNDNELNVLSNDLNHLSILDGGILNNNKILDDVELTVLEDFLNDFDVDITKNDVNVCTSVLGILLCR